ncbi:MAG TPA: response regulator transcription factor [Thermoleophilaceae bacterium]
MRLVDEVVRIRSTWPERLGESGEVRVVVVDDQETFRDAMGSLVAATPGFKLAGEAPSGEDGIAAVDRLSPELVLMDIRMPGMSGIDAARTLAEIHPEVVVILTSVYGPEELPPDLVDGCGAAAFARKQTLRPRLLRELWDRHRHG